MQKVTENYLSKVTHYYYFVTSQHWYLVSQLCVCLAFHFVLVPTVIYTSLSCSDKPVWSAVMPIVLYTKGTLSVIS